MNLRISSSSSIIIPSSIFFLASLFLTISVYNTTKEYFAEQTVKENEWYHLVLQYKQRNNHTEILTYVNLKSVSYYFKSRLKTFDHKKVSIALGQSSPGQDVSEVFKKAEYNFDNIVVWERTLQWEEIMKVYKAQFGKKKIISRKTKSYIY